MFTVIAASTVAIPAASRMRGALDNAEAWPPENSATVMSVLIPAIGVVLIGKGIGGP